MDLYIVFLFTNNEKERISDGIESSNNTLVGQEHSVYSIISQIVFYGPPLCFQHLVHEETVI